MAEPLRLAERDERYPTGPEYNSPGMGPEWVVEVVNLGFGTAFETNIEERSRDKSGGGFIANNLAPSLDIPPNERRRYVLPGLTNKYVIFATYRDIRKEKHEDLLTWEGDYRMEGSMWKRPGGTTGKRGSLGDA